MNFIKHTINDQDFLYAFNSSDKEDGTCCFSVIRCSDGAHTNVWMPEDEIADWLCVQAAIEQDDWIFD